MEDKFIYEYAFIRFVPKVEREEFVNIGIILFCKQLKFLKVKFYFDEQRINSFFGETDFEELRDYLTTWHLISEGNEKGGIIAKLDLPYRFRWLTATRSTIIQSSKVHSGICSDPEIVLNDLHAKYVLK